MRTTQECTVACFIFGRSLWSTVTPAMSWSCTELASAVSSFVSSTIIILVLQVAVEVFDLPIENVGSLLSKVCGACDAHASGHFAYTCSVALQELLTAVPE